ncbi:hypothetical protein LUZ60_009247 [Juncus effusus]|nr:hypothetical protein LUZ60_009247 [Juncus effusus]
MTGVGEMLVSAVVKEVTKKLVSAVWTEISLHWGFKDDMKEMKENLEMIEAVLGDAERKSVTDKSICSWLKKLKSAACDIEDMMCDFETEISPNKEEGGLRDWLRLILLGAKMGKKRIALVKQMKKMRKRLGKIAEQRSQFVLSTGSGFDKEVVIKERETFSDTDEENKILGREREITELLSFLMQSDSDEDVSIIAIVGLGGIGKTTLAQLIYNNERIKGAFNRGWVYVSMEFDLKNIGRALLESFGESSRNISSTLEGVRESLKEKIRDKKCFIVLDDIWEEDGGKLEKLRGMLQGCIKGSKILITTRSENVAVQICATQVHKLKVLSDNHCWSLFSKRAFTSENEKNNDLVGIGKEIVKKCGGIPLAAKSLGYTMRLKKGIDAWAGVRDSEIWNLKEQSGSLSETGALASLKLSYYFMPSYLKLCFGYCSIFPKGSKIIKDELIQQWIALGFIQPMHNGLSLEKLGDEYVNDLLNMSFLQLEVKEKKKVSMHDLVHDLATSIIGDELLILDGKKDASYRDGENYYRYALLLNFKDLTEVCQTLPRKIRAIHFIRRSEMELPCFPDHAFSRAKYLRVLHLYGPTPTEFLTSIKKLKQLRYLCAQRIGDEVLQLFPESFGNLLNLRYMDISHSMCDKLPESFVNLTSLQVLKLSNCSYLKVFPESFGNLLNLRYMDISHSMCKKLPESFVNLTNLQVLKLNNCYKLEVFPESFGNLLNLRYLDISHSKFKTLPEPLVNLTNLQVLKLNYCSELEIFPETLKLVNLQELYLSECLSLKNPPKFCCNQTSLGKLEMVWKYPPFLDNLNGFILVKKNNSSFFDIVELSKVDASKITSHNLEIDFLENVINQEDASKLNLCTKSELKSVEFRWSYYKERTVQEMAHDEAILENLMPHQGLNELIINGYAAPKFPHNWLQNIECFLPNLFSLQLANMKMCEHLPSLGLLPNLHYLTIRNMSMLKNINEALFGGCREPFRRLRTLKLDCLLELEEWPTKHSDSKDEYVFTQLENLEVHECPKLRFEPSFPGSKKFIIDRSPCVLIRRASQRSTSLKLTRELTIESCDLELGASLNIIQEMTSLRKLCILKCNNLTVIPEWLKELISLEELVVMGCKSFNCLPLSLLDHPTIKSICLLDCNQALVEWCSHDNRFKKITKAEYCRDIMFGDPHLGLRIQTKMRHMYVIRQFERRAKAVKR